MGFCKRSQGLGGRGWRGRERERRLGICERRKRRVGCGVRREDRSRGPKSHGRLEERGETKVRGY